MKDLNKIQAINKANQIVKKIRSAGIRYAKRYSMTTAKNTWKVKLYATDRDIGIILKKVGIIRFLRRHKIKYKVLDEGKGARWCPAGFVFWIDMLPRHKNASR